MSRIAEMDAMTAAVTIPNIIYNRRKGGSSHSRAALIRKKIML